MTEMCNDLQTIAEAVCGRLSGWLSERGILLGFEAERGAGRGSVCEGACFRCEPGYSVTGGYVNGTEIVSGGFSVSLRIKDGDTASRRTAERIFAWLCRQIRGFDWEAALDGAVLRDVYPGSQPARMRLIPGGGAVWELRLQFTAAIPGRDGRA